MGHVLSVREARRLFAAVMNEAAYAGERVVIVRHREVMGAFVGQDDYEFLCKFRPIDEPAQAKAAIEEAKKDLLWRERGVAARERMARERNYGPSDWERIKAEREEVDREKVQILALERALASPAKS